MPYLNHTEFTRSFTDSPHGRPAAAGLELVGNYADSWMNLLDCLGLLNILGSPHMKMASLGASRLPDTVGNPLAIDLELAVLLAALAGCDRMNVAHGIPHCSGHSQELSFAPGGPYGLVGEFTQQPSLLPYTSNCFDELNKATSHFGGFFRCRQSESVPSDLTLAPKSIELMEDPPILRDLRATRCSCTTAASVSVPERFQADMWVPALAFLAADSPASVRAFPLGKYNVSDMIKRLSKTSLFWENDDLINTARFF